MAHAGNCQHGRASQLSPATYQFDVRRHWDAVSTQTPCHIHIVLADNVFVLDPKIKDHRFPNYSEPVSPYRRGLTPRTSARTVGEARMALRVSTSFDWLFVLYDPLSDSFPTVTYPRPLATSVSCNAKLVRHFCQQNKKVPTDLLFGSPAH